MPLSPLISLILQSISAIFQLVPCFLSILFFNENSMKLTDLERLWDFSVAFLTPIKSLQYPLSTSSVSVPSSVGLSRPSRSPLSWYSTILSSQQRLSIANWTLTRFLLCCFSRSVMQIFHALHNLTTRQISPSIPLSLCRRLFPSYHLSRATCHGQFGLCPSNINLSGTNTHLCICIHQAIWISFSCVTLFTLWRCVWLCVCLCSYVHSPFVYQPVAMCTLNAVPLLTGRSLRNYLGQPTQTHTHTCMEAVVRVWVCVCVCVGRAGTGCLLPSAFTY